MSVSLQVGEEGLALRGGRGWWPAFCPRSLSENLTGEGGPVLLQPAAFLSTPKDEFAGISPLKFEEYSQRWYAVFTLTRHEKRVAAHCEQRQIESFLPVYSEKHRWKNRRTVELDLPLFPSYCFARITWQQRLRLATVPGVVSIVSAGREPSPIPDQYIAWLQAGVQAHRIRPHSGLAVGDRVNIITGPFVGMQGVLERQKNEFRVVLKLEMIGRSMSVEVGSEEIAPITSRRDNYLPAETYSDNVYSPC